MFVIFIILDTALLLTFTFETVNFFSRPQIYNGTIWGIVQYYYIVTVDAQNQKCVQHGNIIVKALRKEGNRVLKYRQDWMITIHDSFDGELSLFTSMTFRPGPCCVMKYFSPSQKYVEIFKAFILYKSSNARMRYR